jgi:hypothetical protein
MADETYASAVLWLKEQRRGPDFSLVHRENAEYGFRRNLRGLKALGLMVTVAALLFWLIMFARTVGSPRISISPHSIDLALSIPVTGWVSLVIVLVVLAVWLTIICDKWVEEAAEQYAAALLATCDSPK